MNLRDDVSSLTTDELSESLNFRIPARGSIVKRLGVSQWSVPTTSKILRIGAYTPQDAGPFVIAYSDDGVVAQTDDGTAWTTVTTGLTETPNFAQYQDKLYIANGVDDMVQWDGTNDTTLSSIGVNDVQTLTITGTPTSGSFTLTFIDLNGDAHTTAAIAFNASAADVKTALVNLDVIESGDVTTTGGALPGSGVVITFRENWKDVALTPMTTTDSLAGGTAPATHVAHTTTGVSPTPVGEFMAVWRNRLWVASRGLRKVWWSKAGDPTNWQHADTNFVTFPDHDITALVTAGQRSTGVIVSAVPDTGDGVLVFSRYACHRIFDDSDNVADTVTGGANVIIDPGRGCVSARSVATGYGRIFLASTDGIYSTDGHNPLQLESKMLTPIFTNAISLADIEDTDGCFHEGCYYLAFTGASAPAHNRLLEMYMNLPTNDEKQHPWMAHDIKASGLVSIDGTLYMADAQPGAEANVRIAFNGPGDVDASNAIQDIVALSRTGMMAFSFPGPKSCRRVIAYGYGAFNVAVISNDGTQESRSFSMPITVDTWNPSEAWGGIWGEGGASPVRSDMAYYTRNGRYLALEIAERGQSAGPPRQILDQFAATDDGGMKITAMQMTITPLDTYK